MKKLVFSLAIVIGLSFCSAHVFAQGIQQYEYATLYYEYNTINAFFVAPDGTVEPIKVRNWTSNEIKKCNVTVLDFYYALNENLNKKTKEGWEVVNTVPLTYGSASVAVGYSLRRPIKK